MKKLLMVINEDRFFLSHRTQIAEKALSEGWDITLVAKNTGRRNEIEKMGLKFIELPVNPTGMNPKEEIRTFKFLYKLFQKNPDAIIHLVGLKNMMWGGLASRFTKTRGVLYAISGLGTLFGEHSNPKVSYIIRKFLKFGMNKKNVAVIFQNHEDERLFIDSGIVKHQKVYFIKGSGVNLREYKYTPIPTSIPLKIIFTARMLKEKGVEDLIKSAELLRPEYENRIEFLLCGGVSSNPSALTREDMERLTDNKYIKWLGHREDINELLRQSTIMCFPSYYREGLPKSLIEASAVGRPIVTTDSVGCRDTVINGGNGFIVPPHHPEAVATALKELIDNPDLCRTMGLQSRKIAEKEYDVNKVAATHLEIYTILDRDI